MLSILSFTVSSGPFLEHLLEVSNKLCQYTTRHETPTALLAIAPAIASVPSPGTLNALGVCASRMLRCLREDGTVLLSRDDREVYTVSVLARGFHNIKEDVYLSLPAIIGQAGVSGVVEVALSLEEAALLQSSAAALRTSMNKLHL